MHASGVPVFADERLREVAPILAAGLLRLESRAVLTPQRIPRKSSENAAWGP